MKVVRWVLADNTGKKTVEKVSFEPGMFSKLSYKIVMSFLLAEFSLCVPSK